MTNITKMIKMGLADHLLQIKEAEISLDFQGIT